MCCYLFYAKICLRLRTKQILTFESLTCSINSLDSNVFYQRLESNMAGVAGERDLIVEAGPGDLRHIPCILEPVL